MLNKYLGVRYATKKLIKEIIIKNKIIQIQNYYVISILDEDEEEELEDEDDEEDDEDDEDEDDDKDEDN